MTWRWGLLGFWFMISVLWVALSLPIAWRPLSVSMGRLHTHYFVIPELEKHAIPLVPVPKERQAGCPSAKYQLVRDGSVFLTFEQLRECFPEYASLSDTEVSDRLYEQYHAATPDAVLALAKRKAALRNEWVVVVRDLAIVGGPPLLLLTIYLGLLGVFRRSAADPE